MSTTAEALAAPLPMEENEEFSPELLKAPFLLRCAAAFVDYMVLLAVPLLWLLLSVLFGDGSGTVVLSATVWMLVAIVWLIDFFALPLFGGQTLGKMFAGITIVRTDGRPVRLATIFLRNVVGYLFTILTLGIGFLISAVNRSGRSLHDYIGDTIVVRGRRSIS